MNLNLDDYKNPSQEVLNDNEVANTNFLENEVKEIRELMRQFNNNKLKISKKEFDEKIKKDYSNFNDKFPVILEKLLKGTLDDKRFSFMLKMIGNIQNSKISKHEASIVVGQELVDNIVKPQLNED